MFARLWYIVCAEEAIQRCQAFGRPSEVTLHESQLVDHLGEHTRPSEVIGEQISDSIDNLHFVHPEI